MAWQIIYRERGKMDKGIKIQLGLLGVILMAGGGLVATAAKSSPVNHKRAPIVRLHDSATGAFFCSGTIIGPKLLLTAAHCIQNYIFAPADIPPINIRTADGLNIGVLATIGGADSRGDIALLVGDFSSFDTMKIETRPEENVKSFDEDRLRACGYPRAGALYCTVYLHIANEGFQRSGTGHLWPGMSGGPVVDLDTNRVIGVNTAVAGAYILVSDIVEIFADLDVPNEN